MISEILMEDRLTIINGIKGYIELQLKSGTKDSYDHGLINGLALALSVVEMNDPLFYNKDFTISMNNHEVAKK